MHTFFIAPTSFGVGLTSVTLGLVQALDQSGLRIGYFKPIAQTKIDNKADESYQYLQQFSQYQVGDTLPLSLLKNELAAGKRDKIMEQIVANFQPLAENCDVVIVEGLVPTRDNHFMNRLNADIARFLAADILLVASTQNQTLTQISQQLKIMADLYGGIREKQLRGYILNKVDADHMQSLATNKGLAEFSGKDFDMVGCVPWTRTLTSPRTLDVHRFLKTELLHQGDIDQRRVEKKMLCARQAVNIIETLTAGTLVITSGDREDILLVCAMAANNGVPLAGLLLTNGIRPDERLKTLCQPALDRSGIPVMLTEMNSYDTAITLDRMETEVPADDHQRLEHVMTYIASCIDSEWLGHRCQVPRELRLSPPAFRHQLVKRAQQAEKRIVLPEGEEPRTIQAAIICQERGIARCTLLGNRDVITNKIKDLGLSLPADLCIVEPETVVERYVDPMVKLRAHKGLQAPMAAAQLEDTVVLGTMMLAEDEVDGLVAGAIHTTAHTIRPAFQLIKTRADSSLVSSIFFMLLPDQVLVYGDCAVTPDPDAEQLAEIAIQSADSAAAFGIEPRVAMISYSTGTSGTGQDVDKVRRATEIAKQKRPDLLLDGPLQYDAAAIESVAKSKAPDSPVAGRATVFIFPDLNTGNTTYKAVQRSADVISVGPMLQGLKKPVNDLSRGALVDDIVFTIALTAIQASQNEL